MEISSKVIQCNVCHQSFMAGISIKRHMGTHGLSKLDCKFCYKAFSDSGTRKRHIVNVHKITKGIGKLGKYDNSNKKKYNEKVITCEICGKDFKSHSYYSHIRIHTGLKLFKCQICEQSFTQRGTLKRHINYVHTPEDERTKKTIIKCPECPKEFEGNYLFSSHKKSHERRRKNLKRSESIECSLCNYKLPGQLHYKEHKDENGNLICKICDLRFPKIKLLLRHCKFKHKVLTFHQCKYCEKYFETKDPLNHHVSENHKEERNRDIELISCKACGKQVRKTVISRHLSTHTNSWHSCDNCSRRFSKLKSLEEHRKLHIKDIVKERVQCEVCNKEVLKDSMRGHMLIHTRKKLECKNCFKTFTQSGSLKRHIVEIHQDSAHSAKSKCQRKSEKTLKTQCKICGTLVNKYGIKIHMRTHSGGKPFECEECGKQFTQSHNWKEHKKKHSN